MTALATLEELQAKPIGTKVRVDALSGQQSWVVELTEQGWMRGGVLLLPDMLTGYITAGRVTDLKDAGPHVGEWWQGRSYWYLIREVTDTRIVTLRWRRRQATAPAPQESILDPLQWQTYTITHIEPPSELGTIETVMQFIDLWQDAERRARLQQVENQTLKLRPDPAPLREQVQVARLALDRLTASLTEPF